MIRYALKGIGADGQTHVAAITLTDRQRVKLGSSLPRFVAITLKEAMKSTERRAGQAIQWDGLDGKPGRHHLPSRSQMEVTELPDPL